MKFSILLFMLLFSMVAQGQATAQVALIQAPGASPLGYQQYLKTHPEYISYVDHVRRRMQRNELQEERIFKLSDYFDQNLGLTLLHLKGLQQDSALTLLSLRYMRDLTAKGLTNNLTASEKRELQYLHCKSIVLLGEGPLPAFCEVRNISLQSILRHFPLVEAVLVETLYYSPNSTSTLSLSPHTAYHWTLLSNSRNPIHFFGTYEQLIQQNLEFKPSVEGECEGFNVNLEEFNALHSAQIYFSESCRKVSHNLPEEKSWVQNKKPWLYTAGVIALGVLIYSMKDKKMVINTNSLK